MHISSPNRRSARSSPELCPLHLAGKKVLLIVPDSTRTAPVGLLFRVIHDLIGAKPKASTS